MCVIYACPTNLPEDAELERGANRNRDGAGICWVTPGKKVNWVKGLKSDVGEIKRVIAEKKITFPLAIHFRLSSIGGVKPELTHPFPIAKEAPLWLAGSAPSVLMHNGHITNWKNWLVPATLSSQEQTPFGPWSDSRALAYLVHLKGEGILEFILDSSRALVMDCRPIDGMEPTNPMAYMALHGNWVEDRAGHYWQSTIVDTVRTYSGKGSGSSSIATSGKDTSLTLNRGGMTEDTWTLDELEELATTVKKEQEDALKLLATGN